MDETQRSTLRRIGRLRTIDGRHQGSQPDQHQKEIKYASNKRQVYRDNHNEESDEEGEDCRR